MSISNPDAAGAPFDSTVIAQLANEFFAAWPGRTIPPAGAGIASAPPATPPVEVGALPAAPAIPPSSAVGPLGETELRSLPATASGATLRPPQAGFTPSTVLGPYEFRPELLPHQEAMTQPAVSAAAPPLEAGTASVASAPTEAELRTLPSTLNLATPTASGSSFYFLDQETAPPPATVLPTENERFHSDLLPDLGLLSGPYDTRVARPDTFSR